MTCSSLVGQCDETCALCGGRAPAGGGGKRRSLQHDVTCDLSTFQAEFDDINKAW